MRNGFLTLDSKPLQESVLSRTAEFEEIICERHRAAIWLAGEYPIYSELTVDT